MVYYVDPVNYLLLAELIVIVIVASAFLFYWNRVVGSVFAFFVRLYTWRYYNAYISIGSLQISPLAGRISFRDVEYHSSNLSFRALHGHLTFRYWWLRVRQEGDEGLNPKRRLLPCRISVYAQGVEGFVYNRTPAYDAIVERMKKHEQATVPEGAESASSSTLKASERDAKGDATRRKPFSAQSEGSDALEQSNSASTTDDGPKTTEKVIPDMPTPKPAPMDGVDWFREAMPVELRIVTGSIVLGSDATPMVLVGDFRRAEGTLNVVESRSVFDKYKTLVDLHFEEPKVLMRTNVDWSGPILAHGKKAYDELLKQEREITNEPPSKLSMRAGFQALAKRFPFLRDPKFSSPPMAGLPTDKIWKGLARYRLEDPASGQQSQPKREENEYAKVTTLLDSPTLDLTYYADTPGVVPMPSEVEYPDETDKMGNIDVPPEYGIDVTIHGGTVKYGPWADRQRDALQRAFAPSIFFDTEPKVKLKPGDTRLHTTLIVNLSLAENTTVRIPTREPSKDWLFDSISKDAERRYGWLDVTVGANSSIIYTQAQYATYSGYDSMVVLHLDSLEIASSVNLQTFIKAKACRLSITMPTPLQWNAQRNWGLDITLESPDITLLRDHVTLIADVAKDWSSGALGDFHHFVPMHYDFRVTLLNYAFHLYLNDYNIVDRPQARDDNAFLDIYGPQLISYTAVSTTQYRPEFSVVPFSVSLKDARVELALPKWDTHRSFGNGDAIEVGKIGNVQASGSYRYYALPKPNHQEALQLHLEGDNVVFIALGWALRRLFCVKDNYFGAFTQFTTMQEYLERFDHDPNSVGDPVEEKYRPGRSDSFTASITMNIEESLVMLSDEIYSCERGLVMPVPQLQMSLKSTEHFMELSLDSPPTYVVPSDDLMKVYDIGVAPAISKQEVVFVEGITLKANRLFGPHPRATTYLCLWECSLPNVTAFLTPRFVATLQASVQAVGYNFTDIDNAPTSIYIPKSPPDVTFFKLVLNRAAITFFAGESAFAVDVPAGLILDTSTLASRTCSSTLGVSVPQLSVNVLQQSSRKGKWTSVGSLGSGCSVDIYKAPKGWTEKASRQQAFLRKEDQLTKRIHYMWAGPDEQATDPQAPHGSHVNGAFLPFPRVVDDDDDPADCISDSESSDRGPPSLPGSSSDSIHGNPVRQRRATRRRRGRSITQPDGSFNRSSDEEEDEDDSSSSGSSFGTGRSSSSSDEEDIAEALEARLKLMRAMAAKRPQSPHHQGSAPRMADGQVMIAQQLRSHEPLPYGTVIKISVLPVVSSIRSIVLASIGHLQQAMSALPLAPGRILDTMLVEQTDSIVAAQEDRDKPLMLAVELPSIDLTVSTTAPDGLKDSTASLRLTGTAFEMRKQPIEGCLATLAVSAAIQSVESVLEADSAPSGVLTLEAAGAVTPSAGRTSVAHVFIGPVRVSHDKTPDQVVTCGQGGTFDVSFVSHAVNVAQQTASIWRKTIESMPVAPCRMRQEAALIVNVVECLRPAGISTHVPQFAVESGYGLHVEDPRNIRRDLGWWLLARLRYWSGEIDLNRDELAYDAQNVSDQALGSIVDDIVKLEDISGATHELVRQQHFVRKAFDLPDADRQDGNSSLVRSTATFAALEQMNVRHLGYLLGTRSIAKSELTVGTLSLGLQAIRANKNNQLVLQFRGLVTTKKIGVEVRDSILPVLSQIMAIAFGSKARSDTEKCATDPAEAPVKNAVSLVLDTRFDEIVIGASATDLQLQIALGGVHVAITHRDGRRSESRRNQRQDQITASLDHFDVTLRQHEPPTQSSRDGKVHLVSSFALDGVSAVGHTSRSEESDTYRATVALRSFSLDVRPQMRAFVVFVKNWKREHLAAYKPTIEAITQHMKASKNVSSHAEPEPSGPKRTVKLAIDGLINSGHVQLRVAKAVWLRWELGRVYTNYQAAGDTLQFAVRIAPQTIGAYATSKAVKTRETSIIRLPSVEATGTVSRKDKRPVVVANAELGFFTGLIKPALLDKLLVLYQKLGADVGDTIREIRTGFMDDVEARPLEDGDRQSSVAQDGTPPAADAMTTPLIDVHLGIRGIRVGFRAQDVATTLLFEALGLKGHASNLSTIDSAVRWRAGVRQFSVSLGQLGSDAFSEDTQPLRRSQSAYMIFDVDVKEIPGQSSQDTSELRVLLNSVHTVMRVAALSELSDLIKSWTSELHHLDTTRAAEMAEIKQNTHKILRKIEHVERGAGARSETSWFASRLFNVEITSLGIAIPLSEGAAIDMQHHDQDLAPALLFSIRSVTFLNRKNETARFKVQQMALQILQKFDQGNSKHFQGDLLPSRNRMTLPSIEAEAQMSSKPDVWSLSAHCSATDFKLSLAPDVVDGAFQLLDLYDRGKADFARLEKQYRAELARHELGFGDQAPADTVATPPALGGSPEATPEATPVRTGQKVLVRVSFTFNSGLVELHRSADQCEMIRTVAADVRGRSNRIGWHDNFTLPSISAWLEFAEAGSQSGNEGDAASSFIFNTAVHESSNVLRPSILPFFAGLTKRLETRFKSRTTATATSPVAEDGSFGRKASPSVQSPVGPSAGPGLSSLTTTSIGKVKIRLSLRIDRSQLRFSCAPDSNAYMDLRWESGGFVASTTVGEGGASTLAGSVTGVTMSLSHEFAEEGRSCVESGARDLNFSIAYQPDWRGKQSGLSVVLDTQILAKFRLEAFSAWLIFTSVWIDNAPIIELPARPADAVEPVPAPTPAAQADSGPKMGIAVLARIRSIEFDTFIAVSEAKLKIAPIVLHTLSDGQATSIDLEIGVTEVAATGGISGEVRSERLAFKTVRRSSRATAVADPTMLSMSIEGGLLSGSLFLGEKNIVRFSLDPSQVTLEDDWGKHGVDPDSQVVLSFAVKAGLLIAVVRLLEIPRLLGNIYAIFDMVESQTKIAAQRSETFKARQALKATEPSPAAIAIMQAVQKAGASSPHNQVNAAQRMRFDLGGLDIGMFNEDLPRDQGTEFYHFVFGAVEADLTRRQTREGLPDRQLELSVQRIVFDRSSGFSVAQEEKREMSAKQLIDASAKLGRREVLSLPSMNIKMDSVQLPDSVLEYNCNLSWGRNQADVAIFPGFFLQASVSFKKLLKGLDEQEAIRSRRLGELSGRRESKSKDKVEDKGEGDAAVGTNGTKDTTTVQHAKDREQESTKNDKEKEKSKSGKSKNGAEADGKDRGATKSPDVIVDGGLKYQGGLVKIDIPSFTLLGDSSAAATWIPVIRKALNQVPVISHRFVTLPLEDGMNILLKLYEKQLSDVGRKPTVEL